MGTHSVTMKTLAADLGVSVTTISNAYSKPDRLSEDLRRRILERGEQLSYCGPSLAGRALRSGRTNTCGFFVGCSLAGAFQDPYTVQFLEGVGEGLEEHHSSILLLRSGDADDPLILSAPIDAVVCCFPVGLDDSMTRLAARDVRVVGTMIEETGDWVAVDDVEAGRQLGEHLNRLGHRRIAVIAPGDLQTRPTAPNYSDRRVAGLRRALPEADIRVVSAPDNSRMSGRLAGGDVLDDQHRPTAIVALSDILALGVGEAMRERGITPGQACSLAGFDDIPESASVSLTTVHQDIQEKGRLAALLAMGPELPDRQIILPTSLKIRASTGPAPLA